MFFSVHGEIHISFSVLLLLNTSMRFIHFVARNWSSFLLQDAIPLYKHTPPTPRWIFGLSLGLAYRALLRKFLSIALGTPVQKFL